MDEKTLNDKLDKLLRVTTRVETQVEALMKANSGHRITKLETRSKVLQWVGGSACTIMSLAIAYLRLAN